MADYQNNITTLAKRLKPFFMSWVQQIIDNSITGGALVNRIYRFDYGSETVDVYDGTDAGLTSALAASATGDIVWVLAHQISGGTWTIPAGVEVVGLGQTKTILTGPVIVSDGSGLTQLSVLVNDADNPNMVYAVQGPTAGTAYINECHIGAWNTGGTAGASYGISKLDGQVYMEGGWLEGGTNPTVTIVDLDDWRADYYWEPTSGTVATQDYTITLTKSLAALGGGVSAKLRCSVSPAPY